MSHSHMSGCFALFSVSHFFIGQMALESPPESSALRVDLSRALLSARTRRGTNAAANDSNSSPPSDARVAGSSFFFLPTSVIQRNPPVY